MVLCFSLLNVCASRANAESTRITDPDAVSGSDYTDSPVLAQKLDEIFEGNAGIYRDLACTVPVDTTLGTSPVRNNGVYMFVDPVDGVAKNIGTSCWIYANGVYYTLFGESTGNGIGENSEKLSLTGTGSRSLTYNNLKAWGVRQGVGALIRASGHSMIVLGYDEESLTILDGNGDGQGLVSVSTNSWDRYGGWVEYIVQPKEEHYSQLFGCGMCGEDAVWSVDEHGTLTLSGSGSVTYAGWKDYIGSIKKVIVQDGGMEIGSGMFWGCEKLETVVFKGAAPTLSDNAFLGVTADVLYPGSEKGWSNDMLADYGGKLNWLSYNRTPLKITQQPTLSRSMVTGGMEVTIAAEGDGLSYSWYAKNSGEALYPEAACTGPVYRVPENNPRQQVMCIVTDQYGNFLISDSILIQETVPAA